MRQILLFGAGKSATALIRYLLGDTCADWLSVPRSPWDTAVSLVPVLLGVFALAFFVPRVRGSSAFWAMLIGEGVIIACSLFTNIAFLWYNVIGALVVIAVANAIPRPAASPIR